MKMWNRIKNILANEMLYFIGAPTLIMLGIVLYGIFFDHWYKDIYNIILASILFYILSVVIRLLGWVAGKIK